MTATLTAYKAWRRSFFLLSISIAWIYCQPAAAALFQEEAADSEIEVSFSKLSAEVVDSKGRPVDEAKVKIQILDYSDFKEGVNEKPVKIGLWDAETESGRFEIDAEKTFTAKPSVVLMLNVDANGYLPFKKAIYREQWKEFDGELKKVRLQRAVKLVGKIAPPPSLIGSELQRPRIELHQPAGWNRNKQRHYQQKVCEQDGSFEFLVPEGIKLELIASSDNFAPAKKEIKVQKPDTVAPEIGEQQLGDLHLQNGVVASGQVLNRADEPVAGHVVQISQSIDLAGDTSMNVVGFAVTDENGQFELPPRNGSCTIFLARAGFVDDQNVKTKGKFLIAKPIKVSLDRKKKATHEIDIREVSRRRVFGRVVLEDGEPGNSARISCLDIENGMRVFSKNIDVDEQGNFEMEAVEDAPFQFLVVSGTKDVDTYHAATVSDTSMSNFREHFDGKQGRSGQFFKLKAKAEDVGPLEIVLVEKVRKDDMTVTEKVFDWLIFGSE